MVKSNQRTQKTKQKIQTAFLDLLREVGFKKVTVKMIIENAQINRSTFYDHYLDKYDLLDRIEKELLTKLQAILEEDSVVLDSQDSITDSNFYLAHTKKVTHFFWEERELIAVLLSDQEASDFFGKLSDMLNNFWQSQDILEHLVIPQNYLLSATTNLLIGIIKEWIRTNFEQTEEELNKIILLLFQNIIPSVVSYDD